MEIISMSIIPRRSYVIAAACLAFFLGVTRAAHGLVLDWDSAAWTNASLSNSYDLTGDGVNDITVAVASQNKNIWTTDPTSGVMTPAVTQTLTGGLTPTQNSLMLAANLHTNSNLTMQISFTGGNGALNMPGGANVSFTIFDIDVTTNSDIINSIYGLAPDGTHVAPTITNVGPAVTLTGTGLTQTLTGNAASPDNTGNGNATISFGATLITDVFFTFGNNAGAPRYQDIAIGDISFTPVPEINPAAASVASCVVAVGLTLLVHRRAKVKARHLLAGKS
jgi:hypothetical protein